MKKNLGKWFKGLHASGKVFVGGVVVTVIGATMAWVWYAAGALVMIGGAMMMGVGACMAIVHAGQERDELDAVISNGRLNGNGPKMDGGK